MKNAVFFLAILILSFVGFGYHKSHPNLFSSFGMTEKPSVLRTEKVSSLDVSPGIAGFYAEKNGKILPEEITEDNPAKKVKKPETKKLVFLGRTDPAVSKKVGITPAVSTKSSAPLKETAKVSKPVVKKKVIKTSPPATKEEPTGFFTMKPKSTAPGSPQFLGRSLNEQFDSNIKQWKKNHPAKKSWWQ